MSNHSSSSGSSVNHWSIRMQSMTMNITFSPALRWGTTAWRTTSLESIGRPSVWPLTTRCTHTGYCSSMNFPKSMFRLRRKSPCACCRPASGTPSRLCASITTSESIPWMRCCISLLKPSITLLTTIIVATPSITLIIDTNAM